MAERKITLKDVLAVNEGLKRLLTFSEKDDSKISFKLSSRGARLAKLVEPSVEGFSKDRERMYKKYGILSYHTSVATDKGGLQLDKKGDPIKTFVGYAFETPEANEKFDEERKKLLADESLEIPSSLLFTLEDLEEAELKMQDIILFSSITISVDDKKTVKEEKKTK